MKKSQCDYSAPFKEGVGKKLSNWGNKKITIKMERIIRQVGPILYTLV